MEGEGGKCKTYGLLFLFCHFDRCCEGRRVSRNHEGKGGEVKSLSTTLEGKVFLLDKGSGDEERDTMLREIEREERGRWAF